jgi:hypothetical protein
MDTLEQKNYELRGDTLQEAVEKLKRGQEVLKEEVNGLKTQMSLIIQLLLKGEDNLPSCPPQTHPAPQTPRPWVLPPHQQQPRQQAPPQAGNQNRSQRTQFDPIPITYAELLPALIKKNWFKLERLLWYLKNCLGGLDLTSPVPSIKGHPAMTLSIVAL